MANLGQHGEPELLGILLIAPHLHGGNPVALTRAGCPRTQQARFPAASGSRDDRHLPRRRAIKSYEKVTPIDQRAACRCRLESPGLNAHA
jgi:ribosomal protein S30